ncbi:MAG: hypothetical protein RL386_733 [Bacteroidota bacterium]|jgi:DNA-binding beta-propeller fold protein YncE
MKKCSPLVIAVLTWFGFSILNAQNTGFKLTPISTFYTDIFNQGGAESAAFDKDGKRLFFVNAKSNSIGILNLSNPLAPVLADSVPLATYGGKVRDVATFNGMLAVALEGSVKTANGKVVLFEKNGSLRAQFNVGPYPDMIVFTPDGKKILTANEGEPAGDFSIDPEGSVSIIDIASGMVQTAGFTEFNSRAAELRNRGVRIFGPKNPSVAQDMEPEYIAVSPDGSRAYVTLQENNALAVVDIATAKVLDIQALGFKDHLSGTPQVKEFPLGPASALPVVGIPVFRDSLPPIRLGGFSGLYFEPKESTDSTHIFYTVTDQGPVEAAVPMSLALGGGTEPAFSDLRPYKLPAYQLRMVRLIYNLNRGTISLDRIVPLSRLQNGISTPVSGRTNLIGFDEIPVTPARQGTDYNIVDWVDTLAKADYTELPFDPFGGDMEGIVRDRNGFFWLCDEIRPSLYKFTADGVMVDRYIPEGTSALGLIDLGAGAYGIETLPGVYRKRWANRGFSAIAYDSAAHVLYAFLQTPLDNPTAGVRNNTDVIRILAVNAANGVPIGEYIYLLESNRGFSPETAISRVDNIGDAVYKGRGTFWVIEHDASLPAQEGGKKYIYEVSLVGATNLMADTALAKRAAKESSSGPSDKTLEMMSAGELAAAGVRPVSKRKILNLPDAGYSVGAKPEGLALLPRGAVAVLNDNDFGKAGTGNDDVSSLGVITFGTNHALDASDSDGGIKIVNYPVFGMYQPDGIVAFEYNGNNYYAIANEGDARDYSGFSEETRIGATTFKLDPGVFPTADSLKQNARLGRLRATNASGDVDGDGDYDQVFVFGGRSFAILDAFGNFIFESANDFESNVAKNSTFAAFFNANNDSNATSSRDSRSDDKGPEPSAIAFGAVDTNQYIFITLERIGGIMVYQVNDPKQPLFMGYFNNRNFTAAANTRAAGDLGPEDVVFIPADQSPTAKPLVVLVNAVSGTITVFGIGDAVTSLRGPVVNAPQWRISPNPAADVVFSTLAGDYQIFSASGQLILTVRNTNRIDVGHLPAGTYILRHGNTQTATIFVKK